MAKPYYSTERFTLYNGDCTEILCGLPENCADLVITSPPYNTCRSKLISECKDPRDKYHSRYDVLLDAVTLDEYCEWTEKIFIEFDRVLKQNAVVLYNMGLGADLSTDYNCLQWFKCMCGIMEKTNFCVVDMLFWHKRNAMPNNVSPNMSTRIVEPVLVLCRKNERGSFICNKKISSVREGTTQKMYVPFYNIFNAANNDECNDLNKATYSTEFCSRLIDLYVPEGKRNEMILDPFNGTGTTGIACMKYGMSYIGIELSEAQCSHTIKRLSEGVQMVLL